jgi:hypothetical protein
MSLCASCQRIALGGDCFAHKPNFQALIDSTAACDLCRLLFDQFKISSSNQHLMKSVAPEVEVLLRVSYHHLQKEIFCLGLEFSDKNKAWQAPDSLTFCPKNCMYKGTGELASYRVCSLIRFL